MIGRLKEFLRLSGGEWLVSFTTRANPGKLFDQLKDDEISVEMVKWENLRSKDANALMWSLCTEIGNALRPPVPKTEVYRRAIKDVGHYFPVPVRDDLIEEWKKCWSRKGTGWFAEVTDRSKNPGYTLMFSYCGSSTYTVSEMSRLIDYLKDEMEQMGLPLKVSKEEEERLLAQWGKASCKPTEPAISAGE